MPTAKVSDELKRRIPGWGADLDFRNRPGFPMEKTPPHGTGAHWEEPERQIPTVKVFHSIEHKGLTPVFGTACPPKGLSGSIRDYAYTLSEGRKMHWALLLFADRVDVVESALQSLLQGRPHNPLAEMGLQAEFKRKAFQSRFGQHRSDVRRQKRELLLALGFGGLGAGAYLARRAMGRRAA